MKLTTIFSAMLLLMGSIAHAQTAISVKGKVVGNADSCMVVLSDCENPQESIRLAEAKFTGEEFTLCSQMKKVPRFARLSYSLKTPKGKWHRTTDLRLLLDGSPVFVKIDKDLMTKDMAWQEKQALINQPDGKLVVEAGKAQESYADYLSFVRDASITADSASYAEAEAWFANNGNDEAIKDYKQRNEATAAAFTAKRNEYINLHPDAPITAALVAQYAYVPFSYDLEVFDRQYASLGNNDDTTHVNFIKRNIDYFRSHANGAGFTNFTAETKDGNDVDLASLMKPGKMMVIDFWASWCGPCRAAIPKVKQMAKLYADKLDVVSCSVDEKRDAWLKAEKEEAMPWTQLFLPLSKLDKTAMAYSITSIPRLVLIGADGKIICITHSPEIIQRCLVSGACAQKSAQEFVIKGNIKGIKHGTKVCLRAQEQGRDIKAECLSQGSTFVLKGKVEGTMLVQLCIDNKPKAEYAENEYAEDRGGNFMLEAANYQVSASCYDSIPRNFDLYAVPMVHEKNLKIVGGKAQQQYQEWADATYDSRLKYALIDKQLWQVQYGDRKSSIDTAAVNRLQPLVAQASEDKDAVNRQFMDSHPDYAISLLQKDLQIGKPFAMTVTEYDESLKTFANNYDQTRYADYAKHAAQMKKYPKGAHYHDLTLETADSTTTHLKDVVVAGKYNFIDFWASWCGPCRAAIPSVKKLHAMLGDRLNIVSISVDKQRKDWQRAVEEEKMPWRQYLVPQSSVKALVDAYFVRYIPSLVVIDPEGNIQLFTNAPDEAHLYLKHYLNAN